MWELLIYVNESRNNGIATHNWEGGFIEAAGRMNVKVVVPSGSRLGVFMATL